MENAAHVPDSEWRDVARFNGHPNLASYGEPTDASKPNQTSDFNVILYGVNDPGAVDQ